MQKIRLKNVRKKHSLTANNFCNLTYIENSTFILIYSMKDKVRKLDVAFDPVHQKIADGLI